MKKSEDVESQRDSSKTPEQLAEIKSRMEYELWMKQQREEGKALGILHPKDKKADWNLLVPFGNIAELK